MKAFRCYVSAGCVALSATLCFIFSSCSSLDRTVVAPPEIAGAHYVGNTVCAECHTNIARAFPGSPHARFYKDDLAWAARSGCESCHGAGSEHVRVGGGRGKFIVNPGKDPASCFQCHVEIQGEFNLPVHHPIPEDRMNCIQCHDPHGREIFKPSRSLAMSRQNDTCGSCHRDQHRPFVFEHQALRQGCLTCHSPHGSINEKLLNDRDVNLCLKCHAQVQNPLQPNAIVIGKIDHTGYLKTGACFSAGCHSAVHGSNVNPMLLY